MKRIVHLLMLLVIVFTFMQCAVLPAAAQEPDVVVAPPAEASEVSQAADVLVLVGIGVAVLILLLIAIWGASFVAVEVKSFRARFLQIDRQLVPFGLSGMGKAVYQAVDTVYKTVDDATDPRVIQLTHLVNNYLQEAPALFRMALPVKDEPLTPEDMAKATTFVVGGLKELLNGVQATSIPGVPETPMAQRDLNTFFKSLSE